MPSIVKSASALGKWGDVLVLAGSAGILAWGLGAAALWDPLEVDLADRARHPLATDPAAEVVHVAFRLFGESAAAARASMTIAVVVAMVALWAFVACVESVQTARFLPLVFATTPSLFVHGRTALPDALAVAALALAFAGLGTFALDAKRPWRTRAPALALGVLGLFAGRALAGPLLGAAVPLGAIAVATLLGERTRFALVVGGVFGVGAAVALRYGLLSSESHAAPLDGVLSLALHGAFPWSALLPLAIASVRDRPVERAAWLFAAALLAALSYLRNHAPHVADVAPLAVVLLATLALAPRDQAVSRPAILASAVLAVLLGFDFDRLPAKAAAAWGDAAPALPATVHGQRLFVAAAALTVVAAVGAAIVRNPKLGRAAFAFGTLGAALLLRARFYPAVAVAASPSEAFAAYRGSHHDGEPLGALDVSAGTLRFAHVGAVTSHDDAPRAFAWLTGGDGRRFLVAPRTELAALNALQRRAQRGNLPVVGGADSAVLLLSNRPDEGTAATSPLDAFVRDDVPAAVTPTTARFGDALELAGYAIEDDRGAPATMSTHGDVHLKLYWRVLRAPVGHCTFIHLDRSPARFAAEHTAFTEYPTSLWQRGDVIVDDYAVRLPLAFRGALAPAYVGVGVLPCSDDRRMPVTAGTSDGHERVLLGRLVVR